MLTYDFQCSKCKTAMRMRLAENVRIQIYCLTCNTPVFDSARPIAMNPQITGSRDVNTGKSNQVPLSAAQLGQSFGQIRVPPAQKAANPTKAVRIKDRYVLKGPLGEGAMGKVYLAYDEKKNEQVAVKILVHKDEKLRDYFRREAMVLNDLNHPNIVAFKDCGNHNGHLFIVMEHVDGETLAQILTKSKGLLPRHAIQLITSVLDAIQYAYEHNIVHRDIKPANIFLNKNRIVKVIDLGLGKVITESLDLTKTGQIMGTGFYMPLEQIQKSKDASHSADVYAIGATLYHSLCGIPPFEECGKDLAKLFTAKIRNNYVRLSERGIDLPPKLIEIVEKAMGHKPDDRYNTALEMKQDIEKIM